MGIKDIYENHNNGTFKFYWDGTTLDADKLFKTKTLNFKDYNQGKSQQPYIITPPPDESKNPKGIRYLKTLPDIVNRGNLLGVIRAADDVVRLTKYFTDFKSLSGAMFVVKQALLEGFGNEKGTEYFQKVYNKEPTPTQNLLSNTLLNPLLTTATIIAQAAVSNLGFHIPKFPSTSNLSHNQIDDIPSDITSDELSLRKDYKNIETRIGIGNPGRRGNLRYPEDGKYEYTIFGKKIKEKKELTLIDDGDSINLSEIYSGTTPNFKENKDLINFSIGVYDNTTIGDDEIKLKFMHFRVFLKGYSDSFNGEWKPLEYMGRGEGFYKYKGFKRDISFSFTVAASTKEELNPIYAKLNYLASTIAPYYSQQGYMSGNFHQITLGNWLNSQPGFISSVDLTIPDESPWEVNLHDDPNTQQLPHMIEVKIKFTPIHRFRPEIQKEINDPNRFFSSPIYNKSQADAS